MLVEFHGHLVRVEDSPSTRVTADIFCILPSTESASERERACQRHVNLGHVGHIPHLGDVVDAAGAAGAGDGHHAVLVGVGTAIAADSGVRVCAVATRVGTTVSVWSIGCSGSSGSSSSSSSSSKARWAVLDCLAHALDAEHPDTDAALARLGIRSCALQPQPEPAAPCPVRLDRWDLALAVDPAAAGVALYHGEVPIAAAAVDPASSGAHQGLVSPVQLSPPLVAGDVATFALVDATGARFAVSIHIHTSSAPSLGPLVRLPGPPQLPGPPPQQQQQQQQQQPFVGPPAPLLFASPPSSRASPFPGPSILLADAELSSVLLVLGPVVSAGTVARPAQTTGPGPDLVPILCERAAVASLSLAHARASVNGAAALLDALAPAPAAVAGASDPIARFAADLVPIPGCPPPPALVAATRPTPAPVPTSAARVSASVAAAAQIGILTGLVLPPQSAPPEAHPLLLLPGKGGWSEAAPTMSDPQAAPSVLWVELDGGVDELLARAPWTLVSPASAPSSPLATFCRTALALAVSRVVPPLALLRAAAGCPSGGGGGGGGGGFHHASIPLTPHTTPATLADALAALGYTPHPSLAGAPLGPDAQAFHTLNSLNSPSTIIAHITSAPSTVTLTLTAFSPFTLATAVDDLTITLHP